MAPASISTSANGLPLVQLRSFERMYTVIDNASVMVAHVLLVRGPTAPLLAHLPTALTHVYNLHPRMRATQTREPAQHAEIQPPISLEDVASRRLLRVFETSSEEEQRGAWKQHVEQEAMRPVNRFEDFPNFLEVWADRNEQFARLILFSDHYMLDGISGMIVLNDVLTRVAQLARGEVVEPKENPVRPSSYNMLLDAYKISTPLSEFIVKMLLGLVRRMFSSVKPIIPPRSNQKDFVYPHKANPTYAKFDSGDAANILPIMSRCKEEGVTYTGALLAMIVLAFYHASQKYKPGKLGKKFKMYMSVATNLRARLSEPLTEDTVGDISSFVKMGRLNQHGVKLKRKFWDVARQCKSDLHSAFYAPTMALPDVAVDQLFESVTARSIFTSTNPVPKSCVGDVDVSNIGRYPYAMTHDLGGGARLSIETLHLYDAFPGVALGSYMYVSSTDRFNYSMLHKYEDDDGDTLFRAYVAFAEHIGKVGSDETMADVYAKVASQFKTAA